MGLTCTILKLILQVEEYMTPTQSLPPPLCPPLSSVDYVEVPTPTSHLAGAKELSCC